MIGNCNICFKTVTCSKWYKGPKCSKCYKKEYRGKNPDSDKARMRRYYDENKDKINKYRKNHYQENKASYAANSKTYYKKHGEKRDRAYFKKYSDKNRPRYNEKQRIYRENNLEKSRASCRKWEKLNPGKVKANVAARRGNKINATPKWLTKEQKKEIVVIYDNCPKGYHVDHIIPLKNKNVCGLHVPWNLQYLTAKANMEKKNKLLPQYTGII